MISTTTDAASNDILRRIHHQFDTPDTNR